MALKLEMDSSDIWNEIIYCVRKGGTIGDVGVYAGYTNHYNIGAFMEKGMHAGAGQTPVQLYWKHLLELVVAGKLHPEWVITHTPPLEKGPEMYHIFDAKQDNCVKVVLKPQQKD